MLESKVATAPCFLAFLPPPGPLHCHCRKRNLFQGPVPGETPLTLRKLPPSVTRPEGSIPSGTPQGYCSSPTVSHMLPISVFLTLWSPSIVSRVQWVVYWRQLVSTSIYPMCMNTPFFFKEPFLKVPFLYPKNILKSSLDPALAVIYLFNFRQSF